MRSQLGFESILDSILEKTSQLIQSNKRGGRGDIIIKDLHKNKASYTNGLCKMEQQLSKEIMQY